MNNRVQKFDGNGNYLGEFGSAGAAPGQFNWPEAVVIDPSGAVWVTDRVNNRVQKFESDETFLGTFGSAGSANGQFAVGAIGLALDAYGDFWVTDA